MRALDRFIAVGTVLTIVCSAGGVFAQAPAGGVPGPRPAGSQSWEEAPAPEVPGEAQATPPPGSYTEPPAPGAQEPPSPVMREAAAPEPPPFPLIYEPPPPPVPKHIAPNTALWLGARVGWWLPFGTAWGICRAAYGNSCSYAEAVPLTNYANWGVMAEGDVGVRLARRYTVFVLWEHAGLGGADVAPAYPIGYVPPGTVKAQHTNTDYYAIGARFSSDPDRTGFLAEIDIGFRRMVAHWDDGTELRLSEAPFEFRLGLGADLRLSPHFALSPMATVGTGVFGNAEWVYPDGTRADAFQIYDVHAAHGWVAIQVGGHVDLGG